MKNLTQSSYVFTDNYNNVYLRIVMDYFANERMENIHCETNSFSSKSRFTLFYRYSTLCCIYLVNLIFFYEL